MNHRPRLGSEFRLAPLSALLAAACILTSTLAAKPGELDGSFTPGSVPSGGVSAVVIDPAGKLVVGGSFKDFNGAPAGGLVRLLPDGKIDPNFKPGQGAHGGMAGVKAIELLENGKILVAGSFTHFGGKEAMGIVMLAADGSVDPGFRSPLSEKEMSAGVTCIESFPDGRIAVGGYFPTYGGKPAGRLAFIKPTGELDPAMTQGAAESHVYDIDRLPDGGALVAGFFQNWGDHPTAAVARLKADGSVDKSFHSTAAKSSVAYTVEGTADGKVIAGGSFKTVDGGKRFFARLTTTGSLDGTFAANDSFDGNVYGITVDPLGRVLVAGQFKEGADKATTRLVRLRADGTQDKDFIFAPPKGPTFIQEYPVDREGRVIVYGWNNQGRGEKPPALYRILGGP